MIQQSYAMRKRKFRNLTKQINGLLTSHRWYELTEVQRKKLTARLNKRVLQVRSLFTRRELKKVLAGAVILIGLTGNIQAQDFAPPVQNPFSLSLTGMTATELVDIDADGDLDLFTVKDQAGYNAVTLEFYENTGTPAAPIFSNAVSNPFNIVPTSLYYFTPAFADLDSDGDLDMMIVGDFDGYSNYTLSFRYFENIGTVSAPAYAAPQTNPFGLSNLPNQTMQPEMIDMDNDGDLDMIIGGGSYTGAGPTGNKAEMEYFENTGSASSPAFTSQPHPFDISTVFEYLLIAKADLDRDGDFDILSGIWEDDDFYYFENTSPAGQPATWAPPTTNPFNLQPANHDMIPAFGDLDNDGDQDLLMGSFWGQLTYYENLDLSTAIDEPVASRTLSSFNIYPNPAENEITVQLKDQPFVDNQVTVINELGIMVKQFRMTSNQQSINVEDLPAGFYIVELKSKEESIARKLIIK